MSSFVLAVDGTAGSGKSSTSRGVARRLGLRYLDTGAMYRAMTWRILLDRIPLDDIRAIADRAEGVRVESGTDPLAPTITLDGEDVSREVRSDAVTAAVSAVSAVPRVRELLRAVQRRAIGTGGIVVEGRDIGTVVAPDADLKIYLTAESETRAVRRSAELTTEHDRDLASVEAALQRRDAYDSTRVTAPLLVADDAVVLDTTAHALEDVIDTIVALAHQCASAADPRPPVSEASAPASSSGRPVTRGGGGR